MLLNPVGLRGFVTMRSDLDNESSPTKWWEESDPGRDKEYYLRLGSRTSGINDTQEILLLDIRTRR